MFASIGIGIGGHPDADSDLKISCLIPSRFAHFQ